MALIDTRFMDEFTRRQKEIQGMIPGQIPRIDTTIPKEYQEQFEQEKEAYDIASKMNLQRTREEGLESEQKGLEALEQRGLATSQFGKSMIDPIIEQNAFTEAKADLDSRFGGDELLNNRMSNYISKTFAEGLARSQRILQTQYQKINDLMSVLQDDLAVKVSQELEQQSQKFIKRKQDELQRIEDTLTGGKGIGKLIGSVLGAAAYFIPGVGPSIAPIARKTLGSLGESIGTGSAINQVRRYGV